MTKRILFTVLAVLLFFGGLEGVLRLAGFAAGQKNQFVGLVIEYRRDDPEAAFRGRIDEAHRDSFWESSEALGWRLKPNWRGVHLGTPVETNSLGFRGPEPEPFPGTTVLCLGDSVTFGLGMEWEETYPAQLGVALNRMTRGERFRTLCAGVPGYSTHQGELWYRQELRKLPHDYVVAAFGLNDATRRPVTDRLRLAPRPSPLLRGRELILHLRLVQGLRRLLLWTRGKANPKTGGGAARVPLEEFRENLLRLNRSVLERDARLILFDQPTLYAPTDLHQAALVDLCRQEEIPLVPVRQEFEACGFPGRKGPFKEISQGMFHSPSHPSAAGYHLIAELVAARILELEEAARGAP